MQKKGENMKNTIHFISFVLMAILIAGCSSQNTVTTGDDDPTQESGNDADLSDQDADEASSEMNGIDELDEELDLGELDSLESDLDGLDW